MPPSLPRIRVKPGTRVSRRGQGTLQVGLHHDQRLLIGDEPEVRRLLALLPHGVDPARLAERDRALCRDLDRAGLLVPADDATGRARAREAARVRVEAPDPVRGNVARLLVGAGLRECGPRGPGTVGLLVSLGAEPARDRVDEAMRRDLPHLLVVAVAGRVRLGPFVVPGLTACLRCVDEHLADVDPRHALVTEQHLAPDPADTVPPADLQLATAWAVRDVVRLVEGDRPTTWSATVELRDEGPVTRGWRRHPRCGCAWAHRLTG